MRALESETGLKEITLPDAKGVYLGKSYRGYDFLFTTEVGDVWGRWAARVTLSQLQDFLSEGRYRTSVTGSQLDRLLSRAIGQPLSIIVIAKHDMADAPRLDIITPFSTVKSPDPQPEIYSIGMNTGSIYSESKSLATRLKENEQLMERISELYSPYIRVDKEAITYIYSGPETDLSTMIRNKGSYGAYINHVIEILTDVGEELKTQ